VIVEEYTYDQRLFRELLKIQKQAAIEMGQWKAKPVKDSFGATPEAIARLNAGAQRAREAEADILRRRAERNSGNASGQEPLGSTGPEVPAGT
jgi:hypothetical protein